MTPKDRIARESGGIVAYWREGAEAPVVVRMGEAKQNLAIIEVYLPPDDRPYTDGRLRQVTLDRVNALANEPLSQVIIRRLIKHKRRPSLEAAAKRFLADGPPSLDKAPSARLVSRPSGRPYPSDFYQEVALIYRRLAETERDPATQIAVANDVPVTTVHRWIREARDRGFLGRAQAGRRGEKEARRRGKPPPGRVGKAG